MRAHLRRKASGDFRHRRQQGQSAGWRRDGFIGDAYCLARHQRTGQRRICGEVQIGEENLAVAQQVNFVGLWFLHLNDHRRLREHLMGGVAKRGAGGDIIRIVKSSACSGAFLDQYVVSGMA